MNKFITMVCLLLLLTSSAQGQETSVPPADSIQESAFESMINLRLQTMQIACSEAVKHSLKLELVADQRIEIEQLSKAYKQKAQSLVAAKKIDSEDNDEKVSSLIAKLDDFEKRLSNKILQPDQSKALHSLVFAQLVKANDGDLSTTLTTYYSNRFKFDDSQKTDMEKLKSTAAEKIAKAKQTLEKELEKIAAEIEKEVLDVLTPKQSKLLEELQSQ